MAIQPQPPRWSVDAYLEMERGSSIKHDYLDGHVYAMAGGSRRHSRICVNVTTLLESALRDGSCQVFNSDMKVRVDAKNYVYPDAAVSCDPRDTAADADDDDYISHPILIVEVLSDSSTAEYDRGDKFDLLYKRIDALREYVLVDTQRVRVDVYRRANGDWERQLYGPGDDVALDSVGKTTPIAAFYARVSL